MLKDTAYGKKGDERNVLPGHAELLVKSGAAELIPPDAPVCKCGVLKTMVRDYRVKPPRELWVCFTCEEYH